MLCGISASECGISEISSSSVLEPVPLVLRPDRYEYAKHRTTYIHPVVLLFTVLEAGDGSLAGKIRMHIFLFPEKIIARPLRGLSFGLE